MLYQVDENSSLTSTTLSLLNAYVQNPYKNAYWNAVKIPLGSTLRFFCIKDNLICVGGDRVKTHS